MDKPCIKSYLEIIKTLDEREFLLNYIKYTIAPTLEGVKPSYLMVFNKNVNNNLYEKWINFENYVVRSLDIDFIPLKMNEESIHILFYNKKTLQKVLKRPVNKEFLERFGYSKLSRVEEYLLHLKERYEISCPHEIGVFLGYPVEDVIHFIYPSSKECLLKGYWKVYNDLDQAKETFKKYDRCRFDIYRKALDRELSNSYADLSL